MRFPDALTPNVFFFSFPCPSASSAVIIIPDLLAFKVALTEPPPSTAGVSRVSPEGRRHNMRRAFLLK